MKVPTLFSAAVMTASISPAFAATQQLGGIDPSVTQTVGFTNVMFSGVLTEYYEFSLTFPSKAMAEHT